MIPSTVEELHQPTVPPVGGENNDDEPDDNDYYCDDGSDDDGDDGGDVDGGGSADVYSGGCNRVMLLEMMMPTNLSTTFFSFVQTCSTWWKNS